MSAVRGFTTLQLLELAAIAEANRRRATGDVPVSNTTKQPEDLARSRTVVNDLERFLSQGGQNIQLPVKRGIKIIKYLSGPKDSNAWFNDGRADPKYRARTPEGAYIEQQRGRIYDFVNQNLQYLSNQAAYGVVTVGNRRGEASSASALDQVVNTSWREPEGSSSGRRAGAAAPGALLGGAGSPRGAAGQSPQQAFQARLAKVGAVWQLTNRNQEPEEVERRGGGNRVGQRQPASEADVLERARASNGFLSRNLAEVLAGNVQNRRRTQGVSPQVLQRNEQLQQAIRQAFGIQGGQLDAGALGQARQSIVNLSPQQLHARFVQIAGQNPEALREALWASLGDVSLRRLLGGLGIRKPEGASRRDFRHSAGQQRGAAGEFDLAFSRFVFDQLFDAYLQRGGQGDRLPEDAQRRSNRGGNRGGGVRGILGTNDASLQGLSLAQPLQVATFVFKALQRQYTLEALKAGARALGVPVEESAVLQDAVILAIANHVVVSYAAQVEAGSPNHTSAVATAVRLRGYANLRTPQQVAEARQAILRTLDAQQGRMTEPCQLDERGRVVNYSRRDLKRIAKANGISLRATNMEAACAELSGQIQREAASPNILSSGRRAEVALGQPAGAQGGLGGQQTSGGRSGRRRTSRGPSLTQVEQGGLGGLARPMSAGTQAAFAGLLGGEQPALGGQVLSGGQGSGRRSGGASPRGGAQGGLGGMGAQQGLGGQEGANNLMNLFGQQQEGARGEFGPFGTGPRGGQGSGRRSGLSSGGL